MTNLATFPWTKGNDIVLGLTPAFLATNASANASNGNDAVIGIGLPGAYLNEDLFVGGVYLGPSGVYLAQGSQLTMGNGNDVVFGTGGNGIDGSLIFFPPYTLGGANGGEGIRNRGTISTGNGNDAGVGFDGNLGPIIRGQGGDGWNATSNFFNDGTDGGRGGVGLHNLGSGRIKTGNGRDVLLGTGGRGGDGGNAKSGGSDERDGGDGGDGGDGIRNDAGGRIETGNGDDVITGIGGLGGAAGAKGNSNPSSQNGVAGSRGYGIRNDGLIDMGRGDDVLDASQGGFTGNGRVEMGSGNDTVRGFGSGQFNAGSGSDQLIFGSGTYLVSAAGGGLFNITADFSSATMVVSGFEAINGNPFATGTVVI